MKSKIQQYKNHLLLHWIVFIWGFTAVLGKFISLPASELVWFRMLIAAITFWLFIIIRKNKQIPNRKDILLLLGTGLIVALHWICFFGAIKLSNISVTLGTLATASLFAAFLEPLFFKRRLTMLDVVASTITIIGLYVIFQYEFHYINGILVALLSAFLAALFTVINKKFVARISPLQISFYEMIGGLIGISIFMLFTEPRFLASVSLSWAEILSLLALGTICTGYAYVVSVQVMKQLSAYYVTLAVNMEPVYGIILALIFFSETEHMSAGFYLGAFIILITVVAYPFIKKKVLLQI